MRSLLIGLPVILLLPLTAFAKPRLLRAQSTVDGAWFQRVDTGEKSDAQFAQEVATEFGVPVEQVKVIAQTSWDAGVPGDATKPPEYQTIAQDMADGTYAGKVVKLAPVPAVPIDPKTAALQAIDTSKVSDPATKAVFDKLKVVLTSGGTP